MEMLAIVIAEIMRYWVEEAWPVIKDFWITICKRRL